MYIPKEYWPKMPTFEDDSDEADAIKRMFRMIVQVGAAVVGGPWERNYLSHVVWGPCEHVAGGTVSMSLHRMGPVQT